MARTLFQKVWDQHAVRPLPNGQTQLYIGLHLVHEVTSPQAFADLAARGWRVRAPQRTFATVDHIVPTGVQVRPFGDAMAETMTAALERNCRAHGIPLFDLASGSQGIVHVIGPELGLTRPGMTICCGDSHTSTHGAFGALAFGIGTSQVRDVLASQTLAMSPLKVRRIEVTGRLGPGVYAKDVILTIIGRLGVKAGAGFAYEYAGDTVDRMSMDERMTLCNMSIEGGARAGYVNPDDTTVEYLRGRRFAPAGDAFDTRRGVVAQPRVRSGRDVGRRACESRPPALRRPSPGASIPVSRWPLMRTTAAALERRRGSTAGWPRRSSSWDLRPGSRWPARTSTSRSSGRARTGGCRTCAKPRAWCAGKKVSGHVRALVVPGSQAVRAAAEREGSARSVPRRGLRLARRRLLDVPGDEHRPSRRPRGLRVVVQPEFQGPSGSRRPAARC